MISGNWTSCLTDESFQRSVADFLGARIETPISVGMISTTQTITGVVLHRGS